MQQARFHGMSENILSRSAVLSLPALSCAHSPVLHVWGTQTTIHCYVCFCQPCSIQSTVAMLRWRFFIEERQCHTLCIGALLSWLSMHIHYVPVTYTIEQLLFLALSCSTTSKAARIQAVETLHASTFAKRSRQYIMWQYSNNVLCPIFP